MAELKPEERSLTNIDRKMGYRKRRMQAPQHNGWMFRVGSSNSEGLTVSGTALSVRTSVDEARRLARQNQGWIGV